MTDNNNNELTKVLLQLTQKLGEHDARLKSLEDRQIIFRNEVRIEFDKLETLLNQLKTYADKWKFGLTLIISLGASVGWLIGQWDKLKIFFGMH